MNDRATVSSWRPLRFEVTMERAYGEYRRRQILPLLRLASVIGIAAFGGYFFWDLMLDPDAGPRTGPIRLAVMDLFGLTIALSFLSAIREHARYLLLLATVTYSFVAIGFALVLAELPGGFVAGVGGFILGMIFIPVLVTSMAQALLVLTPLVLLPVIIMASAGASTFEVVNAFVWIAGGAGFVAGFAYLLNIINRRAFYFERLLEEEKKRSEDLLLNILPAEIAARLKSDGQPIADHYDTATVLFADLVGFTPLAQTLPPARLVALLNDLFSRFDHLVEEHGAEKIKTIGDAYMVAAGLSGNASDHVKKVAGLALDMKRAFFEFRQEHGLDIGLRIGVHTGSVVAGVIGKRKFAYDLWGDTVNVASRMESEGLTDEVQISEEIQRLLPAGFAAVPRGKIQIKGHQPREAYLLREEGSQPAQSPNWTGGYGHGS